MKVKLLFAFLGVILVLMLGLSQIYALTSQPNLQFNATPDILYINWTNLYNGTITLGVNGSLLNNTTINITNATSYIINSTNQGAPFKVYNGSAWIISTYVINGTANNTTINFSTSALSAGRYSGNLTIINSTNSSENITNLAVYLDYPIQINSTGAGAFAGNLTAFSLLPYFFNFSAINNTTGFVLSVTNTTGTLLRAQFFNFSQVLTNMSEMDAGNSSIGSVLFNATIWLVPLNITNLSSPYISNTTGQLVSIKHNLNMSSSRNISFWINNTAPATDSNYNFNITNVSASPYLVYGTYNVSVAYNLNNTTLLTPNSGVLVNLQYGSTANATDYIHTGWFYFNIKNNTQWAEFNITLTENVTHELSMTVNSIVNQTDLSVYTVPGANIIINVTPSYQNGTFVSPLNISQFTGVQIVNNWYTYAVNSYSPLNITNVTAGTNYYNVTSPINSTMIGGNYTLYVNVTDNNTNNVNYGTGLRNLTVNATALRMYTAGNTTSSYCAGGNYTIIVGDSFHCNYNVTNYGSLIANMVNVTRTTPAPSCLTYLSAPDGDNVMLGNLSAWGGNNDTTDWWFNATNAVTCTLVITTVGPTDTDGRTRYDSVGFVPNITINFNVTTPSGGTTPGNNQNQNQQNQSTTKSLNITQYPSSTEIVQGSSKAVSIKVKNNGGYDLANVALTVSGINVSWFTVSPAKSLAAGFEGTYTVTFTIPSDAAVNRYSIDYVASASGVSKQVDANLTVLPSTATQQLIVGNLTNYTEWYNNLSNWANRTKASGKNITDIEDNLTEAKTLIDQANTFVDAGNYVGAAGLMSQISGFLIAADSGLNDLNKPGAGLSQDTLIKIGIGIAAVASIGVVFYAVRIRKVGFKPGAGYKPTPSRGGAGVKEKIKDAIKKLKEKFKRSRAPPAPSGYEGIAY